ncbi:B2 protein [Capsicum chacoense]
MDSEDKSWMNCLIWSDEFERRVKYFLEKDFERAAQGNEILCPCRECKNQHWHYRDVEDHLLSRGFLPSYTKWTFHGENTSSRKTHYPINDDEGSNMHDDIDGLLHNTFRNIDVESRHREGVGERLPKDETKFFKLLEEGKQQLYPGCENFS